MSDDPPLDPRRLPLPLAAEVDRVCDRFAAAWASGHRPRAEDYLAGAAATLRAPLLAELLRVELEARRNAGEAPNPDEFLTRFSADAAAVDAAFQATTIAPRTPGTAPRPGATRRWTWLNPPASCPRPSGSTRTPPPLPVRPSLTASATSAITS